MVNRQRGATTLESLGPVVPPTPAQIVRLVDLTADQPDQGALLDMLGIGGAA